MRHGSDFTPANCYLSPKIGSRKGRNARERRFVNKMNTASRDLTDRRGRNDGPLRGNALRRLLPLLHLAGSLEVVETVSVLDGHGLDGEIGRTSSRNRYSPTAVQAMAGVGPSAEGDEGKRQGARARECRHLRLRLLCYLIDGGNGSFVPALFIGERWKGKRSPSSDELGVSGTNQKPRTIPEGFRLNGP